MSIDSKRHLYDMALRRKVSRSNGVPSPLTAPDIVDNPLPEPMARPRCMFLTTTLSIGGAEKVVLRWVQELSPWADCAVATSNPGGIHRAAFEIHGPVFICKRPDDIHHVVDEWKPDIFVVNIAPEYIPQFEKIRKKVKVLNLIVHAFAPWTMQFLTPTLRALYNRVIVIAPHAVEQATTVAGILPGKVALVENMIDTDRIKPADQAVCREALGIPVGPFVFGYLGRACSGKRIRNLLYVLHSLRRKGYNVRLAVKGMSEPDQGDMSKYWDQNLREFRQLADEMRISNLIDHIPAGDDIAPFFGAIDCTMLLSASEGSPMIVWESLAAGVPVISTDVGDVHVACTPETGSIIIPNTSNCEIEAVQAVEELMFRPESVKRENASAAREKVVSSRGREAWREKYLQALGSALAINMESNG